MTQAGLEVCPEHDNIPLHDGRCTRCEYALPATVRELGKDRVARLRATLAQKHPKPAPKRENP